MNLQSIEINEKDKEYIQKQISKAIRSYDWEAATYAVLDSYMDNIYSDAMLDTVMVDVMEEFIRNIFKEKGLIKE